MGWKNGQYVPETPKSQRGSLWAGSLRDRWHALKARPWLMAAVVLTLLGTTYGALIYNVRQSNEWTFDEDSESYLCAYKRAAAEDNPGDADLQRSYQRTCVDLQGVNFGTKEYRCVRLRHRTEDRPNNYALWRRYADLCLEDGQR